MVLRVRPTPTRFPTNVRSTPVDNTPVGRRVAVVVVVVVVVVVEAWRLELTRRSP